MQRAHCKFLYLLPLVANTSFAEPCLRYDNEVKLQEAIEKMVPKGTSYNLAKSLIASACHQAKVEEYSYGGEPLIHSSGESKIEVYSWVKVTEGTYRFASRLFLKSTTQATVLFSKEGVAIGYGSAIYTDSL